jgi:hypothetical protein
LASAKDCFVFASLYRKLRGIDRWPETQATVVSIADPGGNDNPRNGPPIVRISFFYHDAAGSMQGGDLVADSRTSLYNLHKDEQFPIRFNPRRPEEFSCWEAHDPVTAGIREIGLLVGAIAALIAMAVLFFGHAGKR